MTPSRRRVAQGDDAESAPRPGYAKALALLASVFFMWGFCTVLNDILAPHLKAVFQLDYKQAALVQFTFFGAYFVMSLPCARIIERFGYKASIVAGLLVMAAACLLFLPAASLPSFPVFLLAQFVLASGVTLLQVAANPYVAVIGPAHSASSRLNLLQALNSLGDTLAPTFGGLLILAHSASGVSRTALVLTPAQKLADAAAVKGPYALIALVLAGLALLVRLNRLPALQAHREQAGAAIGGLWRRRRLMLGVAAIFVYVGAEVSVGTYLINYISGRDVGDMSPAAAAKYVTYFWLGLMVGRFAGAWAMRRYPPAVLLAWSGAGALALIGLTLTTGGAVAMWSVILVGLFNSIMFPTIFTLSIEGLGPLTEKGSGLLIMAICGGAVLPELQGFLADAIGLKHAFVVPGLCYLYIVYFALTMRVDPAGSTVSVA